MLHSQCTWVDCFSFFNKIFVTYPKKKEKEVGFGDETKENNHGLGGCSCTVNNDP